LVNDIQADTIHRSSSTIFADQTQHVFLCFILTDTIEFVHIQ